MFGPWSISSLSSVIIWVWVVPKEIMNTIGNGIKSMIGVSAVCLVSGDSSPYFKGLISQLDNTKPSE